MAHGLNSVLKRGPSAVGCKSEGKSGIGSRRIFAPHFKLQVLDSYRNDSDCKGNQRATARKYGIHRRQIQKWLQCENNLRNSVGKTGEQGANPEARKYGPDLALKSGVHRQRDDSCTDAYSQSVGCPNARVPAVSPTACNEAPWVDGCNPATFVTGSAPLDYTVRSHSRASQSAASPLITPSDPLTPMDLSLKRPMPVAQGSTSAPVCCPLSPRVIHIEFTSSPPHISSPSTDLVPLIQSHSDVWDLSTKGHKRKFQADSNHNIAQNYIHSPNSISSLSPNSETQTKPIKLFKPYLDDLQDESIQKEDFKAKANSDIPPPCCSSYVGPVLESEPPFYNNNNIHITTEYCYTLHELQPKNCINYFYPINKNYVYPLPECDSSFCSSYETNYVLQSNGAQLKQRQNYSLDFKLSAIESYYQDLTCRGNQRAVANKYNIHRRQVQKWLQQEDELRQRNETTKYMHAVR